LLGFGADGAVLAAVERKELADLVKCLNDGTIVFELSRLAQLPHAATVVEDRYSSLVGRAYAPAGFLPDLLARIQLRYAEIQIVFAETRPLAEEWTFCYLGAASAEQEVARPVADPRDAGSVVVRSAGMPEEPELPGEEARRPKKPARRAQSGAMLTS
jgi:hypothetical protein